LRRPRGRPGKNPKPMIPRKPMLSQAKWEALSDRILRETGKTFEQLNTENAVSFFADELIQMLNGKDALKGLNLTKTEIHVLKRYDLVSSERGGTITEKAIRMLAELGHISG